MFWETSLLQESHTLFWKFLCIRGSPFLSISHTCLAENTAPAGIFDFASSAVDGGQGVLKVCNRRVCLLLWTQQNKNQQNKTKLKNNKTKQKEGWAFFFNLILFIFYTAGSYSLSILYILVYICQWKSPSSSHHHHPPPATFPCWCSYVLYICVSISALQTGSSVPFF